jgi:hypothetical protein
MSEEDEVTEAIRRLDSGVRHADQNADQLQRTARSGRHSVVLETTG